MEKRKKLALAPTGAALAFLCFDFFFRIHNVWAADISNDGRYLLMMTSQSRLT